MAVGKLTVIPETIRNVPLSTLNDARLFIGCFVQENEKSRTHSEIGPQPYWKDNLTCNISEGQHHLYLELVNENPVHGGLVASSTTSLNQVFTQGTASLWVPLISSSGQPFGELSLHLSFQGTHSVHGSSFGQVHLDGQYATSHHTGSFASLGPANPIPSNYGTGHPPPFQPPPSISQASTYTGSSSTSYSNFQSTPDYSGLVGPDGIVSSEKMTQREFEEAKARGTIPTWAKYGGGALALGLAAWGAHELKEHFDDKKHSSHITQQVQHQFHGGKKHKDKKKHKKKSKHGSSSSSSSSDSD